MAVLIFTCRVRANKPKTWVTDCYGDILPRETMATAKPKEGSRYVRALHFYSTFRSGRMGSSNHAVEVCHAQSLLPGCHRRFIDVAEPIARASGQSGHFDPHRGRRCGTS